MLEKRFPSLSRPLSQGEPIFQAVLTFEGGWYGSEVNKIQVSGTRRVNLPFRSSGGALVSSNYKISSVGCTRVIWNKLRRLYLSHTTDWLLVPYY